MWKSIFDTDSLCHLNKHLYSVKDDFLRPELVASLIQEMEGLYESGEMGSNRTAFMVPTAEEGSSRIAELISKPNIFEVTVSFIFSFLSYRLRSSFVNLCYFASAKKFRNWLIFFLRFSHSSCLLTLIR